MTTNPFTRPTRERKIADNIIKLDSRKGGVLFSGSVGPTVNVASTSYELLNLDGDVIHVGDFRSGEVKHVRYTEPATADGPTKIDPRLEIAVPAGELCPGTYIYTIEHKELLSDANKIIKDGYLEIT